MSRHGLPERDAVDQVEVVCPIRTHHLVTSLQVTDDPCAQASTVE